MVTVFETGFRVIPLLGLIQHRFKLHHQFGLVLKVAVKIKETIREIRIIAWKGMYTEDGIQTYKHTDTETTP